MTLGMRDTERSILIPPMKVMGGFCAGLSGEEWVGSVNGDSIERVAGLGTALYEGRCAVEEGRVGRVGPSVCRVVDRDSAVQQGGPVRVRIPVRGRHGPDAYADLLGGPGGSQTRWRDRFPGFQHGHRPPVHRHGGGLRPEHRDRHGGARSRRPGHIHHTATINRSSDYRAGIRHVGCGPVPRNTVSRRPDAERVGDRRRRRPEVRPRLVHVRAGEQPGDGRLPDLDEDGVQRGQQAARQLGRLLLQLCPRRSHARCLVPVPRVVLGGPAVPAAVAPAVHRRVPVLRVPGVLPQLQHVLVHQGELRADHQRHRADEEYSHDTGRRPGVRRRACDYLGRPRAPDQRRRQCHVRRRQVQREAFSYTGTQPRQRTKAAIATLTNV